MKILLDTSVLIDALRNRNQRRQYLAELVNANHALATTVVNVAELYAGMRPNEARATEALLGGLLLIELTGEAAREGGRLKNEWGKRGRTLTLADALIAAMAVEQQCALLTDNGRDFPMREVRMWPNP